VEGKLSSPVDTAARLTLRDISPRFADGVDRLYAVLETDGALPAARKALFTAAAAAAADQPALLASSLDRARAGGIEAADVAGTALLLMLNRGQRAQDDFVAAATRCYGPLPALADSAEHESMDTPEQGLAYLAAHFRSEVPPRSQLFSRVAPGAFTGYCLMHSTAINHNAFEPKLAELTLCAVLAALWEFGFVPVHAQGARTHGAGDEELAEAVLCAVPVAGVTAWAGGAGAILATAGS
jgi:alkylhydroperoxidase/carboxymuconolactone decarboxylase family protein YurZ